MNTSIALVGTLVLWLSNGDVKISTEPLALCREMEAAAHHADGLLELEDFDAKITNAWCIDVTKGNP